MLNFPGKDALRRLLSNKYCRRARCLFVLSTGRCGTTTLTSLLARSPDVIAVHEPFPLFLPQTKRAYQEHPLSETAAHDFLEEYARHRFRYLFTARRKGRTYAECSNRLTYVCPLLAAYFPNARFLHLYRHPADIVRSAMRRGYYAPGTDEWSENRIVPRPDDPWHSAWHSWDRFEKCCWYWQAVNAFSASFVDSMPRERVLSVGSEALFGDGGATGRKIFAWLQVAAPPGDDIQRILSTPENAQTRGAFPKWSEWTAQQRDTLGRIVGDVATGLGYEISAPQAARA